MKIQYFVIFLFGSYLFLTNIYAVPQRKSVFAVSKNRTSKKSATESLYQSVMEKILPKVHLSDEKNAQLAIMLEMVGSKETPEEFTAMGYAQTAVYIAIGVLLSLISRNALLAVILALIAYTNYKSRFKKIRSSYEEIQGTIEKDLPKMCSLISSKVTHTSNVENILKAFYPIANPLMQKQLNITIADIQTGNVIRALQRFENRVHSPHLSDITRGLIAVHNGDDQRVYFSVKQHEFNREYEILFEKEIERRPDKLQSIQWAIILLFLACIIYPFITVMGAQMSTLI